VLTEVGWLCVFYFLCESRKSLSAITLGDFRSGMGKCFILSCTIKKKRDLKDG